MFIIYLFFLGFGFENFQAFNSNADREFNANWAEFNSGHNEKKDFDSNEGWIQPSELNQTPNYILNQSKMSEKSVELPNQPKLVQNASTESSRQAVIENFVHPGVQNEIGN